jgi:hypothetical protein
LGGYKLLNAMTLGCHDTMHPRIEMDTVHITQSILRGRAFPDTAKAFVNRMDRRFVLGIPASYVDDPITTSL